VKQKLKKYSMMVLVLINALAFGLLMGVESAAASGDYCTGATDGCDCYSGPWSPDGCYDSASIPGTCESGGDCGEQ